MPLLLLSFMAGALTVLAPCILPVLPLVLGNSLTGKQRRKRLVAILASLSLSILVFSLLLKATTAFLAVPQVVWQIASGTIIIAFGTAMLLPTAWAKLLAKTGIYENSNKLLGKGFKEPGLKGSLLIGFALGPVFNSCSPTYALIVATALPASFATGLIYLIAYVVGLSLMLLLIGLAGQRLVRRLGWISNPNSKLHKIIAIAFIIVGLAIMFGFDKDLQTFILERGWYDPVSNLEQKLK